MSALEYATITEESTWADEAITAVERIIKDRRQAWETYERESRAHAETKAALADAEKRAEEAEALRERCANFVAWVVSLRQSGKYLGSGDFLLDGEDYARTHETAETLVADLGALKSDAADDAEARRDARMVGP